MKSKLSNWFEWLDLNSLRSSVKFFISKAFIMISYKGGKE